jgi:hypothetical protein
LFENPTVLVLPETKGEMGPAAIFSKIPIQVLHKNSCMLKESVKLQKKAALWIKAALPSFASVKKLSLGPKV